MAALSAFHGLAGAASGFGLVVPQEDGRVAFHARYPWGTALHVVGADELPAAWRTPGEVARAQIELDPARPLDRLLAALAMERLISVPLADGVRFWCAATGPIADPVAVARALFAEVTREETADEARSRLARIDRLEALLGTVAGALDVREVFGLLGGIVGDVLPHDALVLMILDETGDRARFYAYLGPHAPAVPEAIAVPAHLGNTSWAHFVIDDLRLMPAGADAARRGLRGSLVVPIHLRGRLAGGINLLSFAAGRYREGDVFVVRRLADCVALALSHERLAREQRVAAEAAAEAARLESHVRRLTEELESRTDHRRVVGDSPRFREVLALAAQVAPTETTVLLLGETGTGKEVLARFLHRASPRAGGPFVALNCAALPEQLLEAELFGHERGAFTGAVQARPGHVEQAAGGVLFLDEIGELALPAQAKLLRLIQEREFQRLGGGKVLHADVRLVAATNRDLLAAIRQRTFREDLYYRLNVFPIELPPLRERREDILALSEAFLAEIGGSPGRPPAGISQDAARALLAYDWPGNVRELRNVLERAAILAGGGKIGAEHLMLHAPPPRREVAPESPGDLKSVERRMIEQALHDARFNKSRAAKILGLTRAQLYVRLRRHGLE